MFYFLIILIQLKSNKIFILYYFSQRENDQKQADDILFDMFRNEDTDIIQIGKFLAVSNNFIEII